jgi:soluble lytic murein transglycosylase-like protein
VLSLTLFARVARADLYTTVEEDGVVTITTAPSRRAKVLSRTESARRGGRKKAQGAKRRGAKAQRAKRKGAKHKASKRKGSLSDVKVSPEGAYLPKRALPFKPFVDAAASYYQLPPALIWGVMEIESAFNPSVVSNKGAQGLMQLMPFTSKDMGVDDPFNPEQNIWGAARLLRVLANRFHGDVILTLSAYHAGGGAVSDVGGIPYERTAQYVRSTFNAYKKYAGESFK